MMWVIWMVGWIPAFGNCPENSLETLRQESLAVTTAYDELHELEFDRASLALTRLIGCIREPMSSGDAIQLHQAQALWTFVNGEVVASRNSWSAVRFLDPSWTPKPSWIPGNHPLRRIWDTAVPSGQQVPLERAPSGGWRVDGVDTHWVPQGQAFVLQAYDKDGVYLHTGYHYSVAEVPSLALLVADPLADMRRRRGVHIGGTVTAGMLFLGSMGSLIGAWHAHKQFENTEVIAEMSEYAAAANVWTGTSIGLAIGAAGAAAVTWGVNW
jgi:hypothetical protein